MNARQEVLTRFLDAFEALIDCAREAEVDIDVSLDFGDAGVTGAEKERLSAIAIRLAADPRVSDLAVGGIP